MSCTVVLLPGLDGTGDQFAPLIHALGTEVPTQIVRYPDAPLGYESLQQMVAAALPCGRPYVLLGESFSGPIAVSVAAQAPRGLLGCILCASFIVNPRRMLRLALPFAGLLPPQQFPSAIADFLVMGRFATPELRQMQRDARRRVSSATLLARLQAIARVDVGDALKGTRLPTLYLRATQDRLIPRSAGQRYLRYAQAGRVVELEGPHFLLQARPQASAAAIRTFLREIVE
jgi:pimeloyl-[acyl-carrier protein] methyl ester esterase